MKSLAVTTSKNACERLFLYKFFDHLDESNTRPDEIDTETGVSFKLLTEYLRLY